MWIANLSDGTVVTETEPIPGELTSWRKLLERLKEENLKITGLRCNVENVLSQAFPQESCDGYFQGYEKIQIVNAKVKRLRQGIGSVVGDKIHIIWLELGQNGVVYTNYDIRNLSDNLCHTTLA